MIKYIRRNDCMAFAEEPLNQIIIRRKDCLHSMDLTQPSQENVEYMIEGIKSKLKMASAAAMQASAFSVDNYEDILDIYEVAMGSDRLSISQVEALVSELGRLRHK
jgi:uncharacterized protein YfkK (UPF0435 family)